MDANKSWFTYVNGQQKGPFSQAEIEQSIKDGSLQAVDLIWCDGYENWKNISETPFAESNREKTVIQPSNVASEDGTESPPTSGVDREVDIADSVTPEQNTDSGNFPKSDTYPYDRTELGVIVFYDEVKQFGQIRIKDKPKLFFHRTALPKDLDVKLQGANVKCDVRFDSYRNRVSAKSVYLLDQTPDEQPLSDEEKIEIAEQQKTRLFERAEGPSSAGSLLTRWADIRLWPSKSGNINSYSLFKLAKLALPERWSFLNEEDDPYSILRSYLRYTFYRLAREQKVVFTSNFATFNTGLVDNLYEPIYALMQRVPRGKYPFRLYDFCVAGTDAAGKKLISEFHDRPEPAQYMTSIDEVIFDTSCNITTQWEHVIEDALVRSRYPDKFLREYTPSSFEGEPDGIADESWLKQYAAALGREPQKRRSIKNRISDAIELATKRSKWNYKTAIPNYYPTENSMGLLLPIALLDDAKPDIALVVKKINPKEYFGVTVFPLDMAYTTARIVCRPDSDWLYPDVSERTREGMGDEGDRGLEEVL